VRAYKQSINMLHRLGVGCERNGSVVAQALQQINQCPASAAVVSCAAATQPAMPFTTL
jgi:hypothetical protein